ncbi:hypothetical protein V7103_19420 [Neobacillus drentensis]|jgi:hypothetical protein|uniref:hypothetical protein n=1 Tax=Neobacillus drentensis TaxID=220684 RepID=UPI003000AB45
MLSAVTGLYLIFDTTSGKQYVGSAFGKEGLFGRFKTYTKSSDGGNLELKKWTKAKPYTCKNAAIHVTRNAPTILSAKEVLARGRAV